MNVLLMMKWNQLIVGWRSRERVMLKICRKSHFRKEMQKILISICLCLHFLLFEEYMMSLHSHYHVILYKPLGCVCWMWWKSVVYQQISMCLFLNSWTICALLDLNLIIFIPPLPCKQKVLGEYRTRPVHMSCKP